MVLTVGCSEMAAAPIQGGGDPIEAPDAAAPPDASTASDATDEGTDAGGGVSLARDLQPIFDGACATIGCHTGTRPKAGLNLTAGAAHASLVGRGSSQCGTETPRMRVVPGAAAQSYLVSKLLGVTMCAETDRMPADGPPYLSDAEVASITRWIDQGAHDN